MSPLTNEPDLASAARDFRQGGWIVSILGGAGMIARLLLDDTEHRLVFWIKKVLGGAIVGCLCYFALWGTDLSGIQKSIILSTAGAGSPELIDWIKKRFSKGIENEETKPQKKKGVRSRSTRK